jgi:hypothetical protein
MDETLNVAFFVFDTSWIVFTCVGWIWKRTRPWQLATVSLTALSWVGLGPWFGWGYCPCTDWHWRVRARLGFTDSPSYVQLLLRELTRFDVRPVIADTVAVATLAVAALLGVTLTVRDRWTTQRCSPVRR